MLSLMLFSRQQGRLLDGVRNRLQTIAYFKTLLNFQNDGFESKFYLLLEKQQHSLKQFCLKLHSSLNNVV